jgi:hypothetical protein
MLAEIASNKSSDLFAFLMNAPEPNVADRGRAAGADRFLFHRR